MHKIIINSDGTTPAENNPYSLVLNSESQTGVNSRNNLIHKYSTKAGDSEVEKTNA